MAGTKPKVDRELLGRVAALTPGQQRWLRTVLQSVFTMETPRKRRAEEELEERPRRAKPQPSAPEAAEEPRRRGLEELLSGEGGAEEDFPELADELKGIADIADLLREGGRERRRFGDELMRLFEGAEGTQGNEGASGEEDEEEDEERDDHLN